MEIKLSSEDSMRVKPGGSKNNFIDVSGAPWDLALKVDLFPSFHEIEMRAKGSVFRIFLFTNAEEKSEFDYGFFADAPVIFHREKGQLTDFLPVKV